MTNTSQPAFLANLGSTDTNETGDGTSFSLGDTDVGTALTEIFDNGGDFTPGASGGAIFTAPVTGKYYLSAQFQVAGGTSITVYTTRIVTSNRTYYSQVILDAAAVVSQYAIPHNVLADMDASDTAIITVSTTDSGGKVDDIFGNAAPRS